MDVGTNIKLLLQGRQKATGLYWPFAGSDVLCDVSAHHEIFKKTPFVSGLHSVSRDVVKDIPEIASTPLLTTTMLDQEASQVLAGAERVIAEKPTALTPNFHQDVLRSADERSADGDVVGVKGNQAIDVLFTVTASDAGDSNGNLTDYGRDACTSRWAACATNAGAEDVSSAEHDRFVIAGASVSGGDLENHSYADI